MSEQMRAFALFVLGALLSVFALEGDWFARGLERDDKAMLCVAFFGLPYLLWEFTRKINWWIVLYLAVLIPIYYTVAFLVAVETWGRSGYDMLLGASVGGLVGGLLSLLTLKLRSLRAEGSSVWLPLIGIAVLAVLPAIGLYLSQSGIGAAYADALWLYLPWQIALGWFISRIMRISPPKGAVAA